MATRYLNRFVGAKKLLLLNNSSSSPAFSPGRPHNHLIRLLGTTTTTTTTPTTRLFGRYGLSGIVEGNLSRRRAMSTLGAQSVSVSVSVSSSSEEDEYEELKPAPAAPDSIICFSVDDILPHVLDECHDDLMRLRFPLSYEDFLYRNDWSILPRYCCSRDTVVDITVAFEKKLVGMCVWFLFVDVPTHIKEGVAWALKDICSRTSEGSVTRHAQTKISSFDQESVDVFLVDVLCSKNEEVLKQVCSTLGLLATSTTSRLPFGNGVQQKLMQLCRECDSPALAHILYAINGFCTINPYMREKIIEAELVDGFLRRILTRSREHPFNDVLETEAYYMVYSILKGHCNDKLWKYVKEHLLPPLFDRCTYTEINVMTSGARVISKFIAKSSSRCIKEMVDLGCLKSLIDLLSFRNDLTVKGYCFEAVDTILSLGDAYPKKNKYADMIDEITVNDWEHTIYWEVFYFDYMNSHDVLSDEAAGIVMRYRPDRYREWDRGIRIYGGRPC